MKTLLRVSVPTVYPCEHKKTESKYDLIIQINKLLYIIIGSAMKENLHKCTYAWRMELREKLLTGCNINWRLFMT